jgi:hypothetical protein
LTGILELLTPLTRFQPAWSAITQSRIFLDKRLADHDGVSYTEQTADNLGGCGEANELPYPQALECCSG